jgi:hypothetical protein
VVLWSFWVSPPPRKPTPDELNRTAEKIATQIKAAFVK